MREYTINDFLEIKSSSSPSFSPDGKHISFLSNLTGTKQLYMIPSTGGENKQLTFYNNSINFAIFSPIKNEILFGKDESGNEMTQFYLLDTKTNIIKEITKNPKAKYSIGAWSHDGKFISYSSNERNGKDFDVYIMNIENGENRCVYNDGGSNYALGFSPQDKYLVFKKTSSNSNNDLYLFEIKNNQINHITPHLDDVIYGNPRWLPDESQFFIRTNLDINHTGISIYNIEFKTFKYILNVEWDIEGISISPDGKYLAINTNEHGYDKLNIYNVNTLEKITDHNLPKGNISNTLFSRDSNYLAFSLGDSRNNTDIWILSILENKYWQVTKSPQGVPPEILVEPELIKFKSFDGLDIPAFIYKPQNIKSGDKLPAIIDIHGGPESQYKPGLNLLLQYFVYKGYIVIAPNVRGSSGYGKKYLALDDIEKRMDSVKDIVALHGYLKTLSYIDIKKIVLKGGSYGGYMTLAGLTFYPDLWAGGIDIVGISNLVTFLENTAPYRRALRESEYGFLDKHRDFLASISPMNFIENIKAPLLVIHGANDPRVPLSEAEQIVNKLKERKQKVELIVYKDEGHGLSKLKNRLDAYPRIISFLEDIFK